MADGSAMHVLVIDDDPDTRANLRDILELDGYHVETAGTKAEAFARDNWPEIAAILLDRKLPDGTAEEILPRLKELTPQADILIVTGYADLQGAVAALRQGAADYILKPIDPEPIRASLWRLAQRRQLARELKEAEERALQAERLAAIGQMVTGLAHESGNALARSQACLEMLGWEVSDRPAALDLIARIQKAQDHLQQLYEEVRNYAAPLKLDREVWDIRSIWRQAWENLSMKRQDRKTSLAEETGGVDLKCAVDQFSMEQVFRNIFENSLAACGDPLAMVILVTAASLGTRPALRIAVRDNGPGLTPEQERRIFEPFFTTKTKGTGLGMAITKRIVEAHAGHIEVGSAGPGAEIVITLPRDAR
jgi:signal transduction histidine kinase